MKNDILKTLKELLTQRTEITKKIYTTLKEKEKVESAIEELKHKTSVEFLNSVDHKDPKYSNADKRKIALKEQISTALSSSKHEEELEKITQTLLSLELAEKILRLKERYTFKTIDLLAIKDL